VFDFASHIGPVTYAIATASGLALAWVYRHSREACFIVLVVSAVVMAFGTGRRSGGDVVVEVQGVGRVTFQTKHRRRSKGQQP
jgi:hypothetical protein